MTNSWDDYLKRQAALEPFLNDSDYTPAQPPEEDELPTLESFEEKEVEWLIPGYLPRKQITIICGTGGTGKTSVWVSLLASISSGTATLFDGSERDFVKREPQKAMFFSGEDTVENVIRKKIRTQGGNLKNIRTMSMDDERFDQIRFGTPTLEKFIAKHRPVLCVFDPIQSFIDPKIKMSDRNAMRQNMRCLIEWGEKYGTTFLVVMHSNKQQNSWGRQRMADSADLWDIARCVWMVGDTQDEDVKYLSHEKSNYGKTGRTMLFKNLGGQPTFQGWTDMKDRDFIIEASKKRDDRKNESDIEGAMDTILSELADHPDGVKASDLDDLLDLIGFSTRSIRTAKKMLKDRKAIRYSRGGTSAPWMIKKT